MKSFMRQTKGGLKELINSFGVARDNFRRADDLLSAPNSQFNGLTLIEESQKRKKGGGRRLPKANATPPQAIDQQDSTTDQLSQQIRICC